MRLEPQVFLVPATLVVLGLSAPLLSGCRSIPGELDGGETDGVGTEGTTEGNADLGEDGATAGTTAGTTGSTEGTTEEGTSEDDGPTDTASTWEGGEDEAGPWADDDGDTNDDQGMVEEGPAEAGGEPVDPIACPPEYTKHVIPVDVPAQTHTVGDIDGDGWMDMVVSGGVGVEWGEVIVLMGEDLTSYSATPLGYDLSVGDLDLGDLDGDGDLELVAPLYGGGFEIHRWVEGAYEPGISYYPSQPLYVQAIEIGDLDGDGDLDLLLAWANSMQPMFNEGEGLFVEGPVINLTEHSHEPTLADFDGDGNLDIATAHGEVRMGTGGGAFEWVPEFWTVGYADSATAGDFDSDGNMDVAVNNREQNTVTIAYGDGNGAFPRSNVWTAGDQPMPVLAFDANGDGAVELLTGNRLDGTVTLYCEGQGTTMQILDGGFQGVDYLPYSLDDADFDGDGLREFVTANTGDYSLTIFSASF